MDKLHQTYLLLALTTIIWGIQPLCIKLLVEVWTPVTITAMRYFLIGSALLLMAAYRGESWRMPRSCWPVLIFMGVTGIGINNVMQFTGLQYSTVTNCTLIAASSPAITALLAAILVRVRLSPRAWLGMFISFAGALTVVSRGSWEIISNLSFNPGDVMFLIAQVAWSLYSIAGLKVMRKLSTVQTTGWAGIMGAIVVSAYGLVTGELNPVPLSTGLWGAFAYSVIFGGIMAMLFWNIGVKNAGPALTAVFQNITPVVGMAGGILLFAEEPGIAGCLGALAIFGGVWLTTHSR